jgi:hypothetical protein
VEVKGLQDRQRNGRADIGNRQSKYASWQFHRASPKLVGVAGFETCEPLVPNEVVTETFVLERF